MNDGNDDGVLVSLDWLRRVDAAVFRGANTNGATAGNGSLFYDVRPVKFTSDWDDDADGNFFATAVFFVNGSSKNQPEIKVYAATPEHRTALVNGGYGYAVWRGRWEVVDKKPRTYAGGTGVSVNNATNVIENIGVTSLTVGSATLTGALVFDDEFSANRMEIGLAQSNNLIGGRHIKITPINSPTRGRVVAWLGAEVTSPDASGYAQRIEIAEGANADFANGNVVELTAPPTQTFHVVTNVTLNDDGTLNVIRTPITVVVPRSQ